MSLEVAILKKLNGSLDESSSYKGYIISVDKSNDIIVRNGKLKYIGKFENSKEAQKYIDDLTSPKKVKKESKYVIHRVGTLNYNQRRAQYFFKNHRLRWCYEIDADTFTEREKNDILRNHQNLTSYRV